MGGIAISAASHCYASAYNRLFADLSLHHRDFRLQFHTDVRIHIDCYKFKFLSLTSWLCHARSIESFKQTLLQARFQDKQGKRHIVRRSVCHCNLTSTISQSAESVNKQSPHFSAMSGIQHINVPNSKKSFRSTTGTTAATQGNTFAPIAL